jgi:hypothetical protein
MLTRSPVALENIYGGGNDRFLRMQPLQGEYCSTSLQGRVSTIDYCDKSGSNVH